MEETQTPKKEIPSVTTLNGSIQVETTNIPLNVDGQEISIKMKKLTAGEKQSLVKKYTSVKIVGTQQTGTMDAIGYQIGLLSHVIVEAPFPTTEEALATLPEEVLDYLVGEYNLLTEVKKKA